MKRRIFWFAIAVLEVIQISRIHGQQPADKAINPYAVATFECAGVYWKTSESGTCKIRYKELKSNTWKNSLDLVFDPRQGEYRGSIINLIPNSDYQIELTAGSAKTQLKFKTRNDNFPAGKRTILPAGESDKKIIITESGTPDAYHLVTVPENSKSVLNLKNVENNGIEINADYVIVRGVEIRNARANGIRILKDRHDIVVEQCYITFWGRIGGPVSYGNFEGNMDSGIFAENGTWNLTCQRNLIEDPRGASNDWEDGHPAGPQGISIMQSKGGNVIRYNDIISTEDHGFNDAIGGGSNFSYVGNTNRDSDVYGNYLRNVWDDAIESEGANMNVRIWGNYIHLYNMAIATACVSLGPVYIFRNVMGESRRQHGDTNGGGLFKTGDRGEFGGGRRIIFHNTALQPEGAFNVIGKDPNCMTRNNIFNVPGRLVADTETKPGSDFDYDYFSGTAKGHAMETNSININRTTPRLYVNSTKLEFYPRSTIKNVIIGKFPTAFGKDTVVITDPVFNIKNPLIDSGIILPGFNDDFKGAGPDLGAFEVGNPPLEFGRRAYLKYNEGLAAWEKY
jgi:hypothetical protein